MRTQVKPFAERNPVLIGVVGLLAVSAMVVAALQYQKLPLLNRGQVYSAHFDDAAGLKNGAVVEVSGFPVGKVTSIDLDDTGVLVTFRIGADVRLGETTEAAIKTKSLLGAKIVDVTPRGEGTLSGAIPLDRTVSPYQLPAALGDLAGTISGLDTDRLSESLATVAQTFADTPSALRDAVAGVSRLAQTIDARDAQLRSLLRNAAAATGVLAGRADQIWSNISAVSRQLQGFIAENRAQLRPALDKLNGVLEIVDNRKDRLQQAIKLINTYVMSLGESLSSGPFFKAYVANLLPGQFVQPFIDAAFSDLGVDPATLLPSELTDPQIGQPATPALPVPYPRTGQGGEPRLTLPDAITGKPGDTRYSYREPPPAPPPGGPPPGPPAGPVPAADTGARP